MEAPGPARLYAAVTGAFLVVLGILGFFYDASFGGLDSYEEAFAGLQVNGWLNLFYLATGAVGVLVAGASSRGYALAIGLVYTALAIVGWGSLGLNLAVGVLGLAAAAAGTAKPGRGPRRLKPRAKPARQRV
ncbi:MAG TPA: DUF4383 domain-containing protein [Solirubrobacterales bacterium]